MKARFFCHIVHGLDPDSERLYRWHIQQRTGGVERDSWKQTVDDYANAARSLLFAMLMRGFDTATPVVIGSNGRLMDGAHRVACALTLGLSQIPVHRRVDRAGLAAPWGRAWFATHNIAPDDLARIEADWKDIAA